MEMKFGTRLSPLVRWQHQLAYFNFVTDVNRLGIFSRCLHSPALLVNSKKKEMIFLLVMP